jgi:hypothetical protein
MQLVYANASIPCQLVTLEQALKETDALSGGKRSRRGRVFVSVSHWDTLADLKIRLYEGLKVHPLNMHCYVNGRHIDNDRETLQALDVAADDVVNIVKAGEEEDVNIESVIAYKESMCSSSMTSVPLSAVGGRSQGKERGFAHTALVGGSPVHTAPAHCDGV